VIKLINLLKRNPRLSFEEFKNYYETKHRLIGIEHVPQALYYARRYLRPQSNNPFEGYEATSDFDVITELWFADRAAYEESIAHISLSEVMALVVEDEEKVCDRDKGRFFLIEDERVDGRATK